MGAHNFGPGYPAGLASIQIRQGHLEQIKQTCQKAGGLATYWSGRPLPVAGMADIDFGDALYKQNDLDGAVQALRQGIDLLRGSTEHSLLAEGYTLLSRAIGGQSEAWAALERAEKWLSQMQVAGGGNWAFLAQAQARFRLDQGAISAAARWAEDCARRRGDTFVGYHQAATLCWYSYSAIMAVGYVFSTVPLAAPLSSRAHGP
jgi:hypothetical protein